MVYTTFFFVAFPGIRSWSAQYEAYFALGPCALLPALKIYSFFSCRLEEGFRCTDAPAYPQERSLNQIKFNRDGDLIFSVAKDKIVCAWWSANGERLGTYNGHQGAIWTVDVSPNTVLLATGSADNTVRLWNVKTGECVKVWDFPTAVKRVEFTPDGTKLLAVTEKRMGFLGTIVVLDINYGDGQGGNLEVQAEEPSLKITCTESKATVAGWSYLGRYIIAGHEDGSVSQYDGKVRNWNSEGCGELVPLEIGILFPGERDGRASANFVCDNLDR